MAVCTVCGKVTGILDLRDGKCSSCRRQEADRSAAEALADDRRAALVNHAACVSDEAVEAEARTIILTTAIDIPGRQTAAIVDIVGAEVAFGMNIFKDIANALRDTFGGRSNSVQNTLRDARAQCMLELRREAFRLGADAVIAVRIFYSEATAIGGSGGGILIVAATGTAVKLQ